MPQDARIRLEGRLEKLERAVQALDRAARKPADFARLVRALDHLSSEETRDAEHQVMKLAPDDPALRPVVVAAQKARERAGRVVFARAKLLSLPLGPLDETARAVAAEPVRFDQRVRNPWLWLVFGALGAMWTYAIVRTHSANAMLFYGLVGAVIIGSHLASTVRVIVTTQRLVLGKHSVPLHEIDRLEIERLMTRSHRPYRVTIHTRDGLTLEQRLAWIPGDLVTALRAVGVSTKQATPYFFFKG